MRNFSYLNTYIQEELLSSTLLNGRYNEATATILLALIFDRWHIPYLIMDSAEKFQLIANPGPNEVTLDVGNPTLMIRMPTPEYIKQYIDIMRRTGDITEADIRTHTYTELFFESTKAQKEISIKSLLGLFYYIQSNKKLQLKDITGSLDRIQKSFYLYQTPYIQMHFFDCLVNRLQNLTVQSGSDIDYVVQFQKVANLDAETTSGIFENIIKNQLEYTDRSALCDSLYNRFISQVHDQELIDNVTYSFNLMKVNQTSPTYEDIFRIDKAVYLRPTVKNINEYLEGVINVNLYKIRNDQARMDSIKSLSLQLKSNRAKEILKMQRMSLLLEMARSAYKAKESKVGEKFLLEFEANCSTPIMNEQLRIEVEHAFVEIATSLYWSSNQNVAANHKMVERGLKLVPDSEIIKSAWYEKGYVNYSTSSKPTKTVKKEDSTPKTGRTIRVISKDKKEKVYSF